MPKDSRQPECAVDVSSSAWLEGDWMKEADKIIARYPEKHREYHATMLFHAWQRGRMHGLHWAREQIIPDGNPEVAIEKLSAEMERMAKPSNSAGEKPPPSTEK